MAKTLIVTFLAFIAITQAIQVHVENLETNEIRISKDGFQSIPLHSGTFDVQMRDIEGNQGTNNSLVEGCTLSTWDARLKTFELEWPVETGSNPNFITINNHLFVISGMSSLIIYEISFSSSADSEDVTLKSTKELNSVDFADEDVLFQEVKRILYYEERHAIVVVTRTDIYFFDISNAQEPVIDYEIYLGVSPSHHLSDAALDGNYIYVVYDDDFGIEKYDLTKDPAKVVEIIGPLEFESDDVRLNRAIIVQDYLVVSDKTNNKVYILNKTDLALSQNELDLQHTGQIQQIDTQGKNFFVRVNSGSKTSITEYVLDGSEFVYNRAFESDTAAKSLHARQNYAFGAFNNILSIFKSGVPANLISESNQKSKLTKDIFIEGIVNVAPLITSRKNTNLILITYESEAKIGQIQFQPARLYCEDGAERSASSYQAEMVYYTHECGSTTEGESSVCALKQTTNFVFYDGIFGGDDHYIIALVVVSVLIVAIVSIILWKKYSKIKHEYTSLKDQFNIKTHKHIHLGGGPSFKPKQEKEDNYAELDSESPSTVHNSDPDLKGGPSPVKSRFFNQSGGGEGSPQTPDEQHKPKQKSKFGAQKSMNNEDSRDSPNDSPVLVINTEDNLNH